MVEFGDLGVPCCPPEGPASVCSRWAVVVIHSLVCSLCVWGWGTGWGDRAVGKAFHLAVQLWRGKAGERLSEPDQWPPGFWAPVLVLSFSSGQFWFALASFVVPCCLPYPGRETLLLMHQFESTCQGVGWFIYLLSRKDGKGIRAAASRGERWEEA